MWKWAKVKVFPFLFCRLLLPVLHIIIICLNCFSFDLFTSRAFWLLTLVCGVRKFVVRASGSREILTTWLKIYYYTRHAAKGPDQLVYFRTEIALWQSGFTIPSPPTPTEPLDNRATASAHHLLTVTFPPISPHLLGLLAWGRHQVFGWFDKKCLAFCRNALGD